MGSVDFIYCINVICQPFVTRQQIRLGPFGAITRHHVDGVQLQLQCTYPSPTLHSNFIAIVWLEQTRASAW